MTQQLNYRKELTEAGLKNTKARSAVMEILIEENRPIDVPELLLFLAKKHIEVDQATVYRMLDSFRKSGIIERYEFQEGKFRYERKGEDHHHLICENCGNIQDISDCSLDVWEKLIAKKKKFLVKHHALEFFGICHACFLHENNVGEVNELCQR